MWGEWLHCGQEIRSAISRSIATRVLVGIVRLHCASEATVRGKSRNNWILHSSVPHRKSLEYKNIIIQFFKKSLTLRECCIIRICSTQCCTLHMSLFVLLLLYYQELVLAICCCYSACRVSYTSFKDFIMAAQDNSTSQTATDPLDWVTVSKAASPQSNQQHWACFNSDRSHQHNSTLIWKCLVLMVLTNFFLLHWFEKWWTNGVVHCNIWSLRGAPGTTIIMGGRGGY